MTQRAVNDICRETELAEGLGCISCGTKTAFAWHAGHYRSTAAAGHLRFTRFNIHLQCDVCNVYKSGNIEAYRTALVERYGEAAVLALENNNTPHRWTVEELKEIRLAALADLRALKSWRRHETRTDRDTPHALAAPPHLPPSGVGVG